MIFKMYFFQVKYLFIGITSNHANPGSDLDKNFKENWQLTTMIKDKLNELPEEKIGGITWSKM